MLTTLAATCAATLLESTPFILAGALLTWAPLRRSEWVVPYLGCGCGAGPSARSLPAAAAAWVLFGPWVAAGRLAAAMAVDRLRPGSSACAHGGGSLLAQLASLVPIAGAGAVVALLAPAIFGTRPPAAQAFLVAAVAAFAASPCSLGAAGFAGVLRGFAPAAAAGFLCVAGIADLRAWMRPHGKPDDDHHDLLAYCLCALACAIAALHRGAGLVHPAIGLALWACALACCALAYAHRHHSHARLRLAPAIMVAGALVSAPPPQYHATETTIADAFAGERVDFTGVVTRTNGAATLVRYAITCCRADAAPIVLRLLHAPGNTAGWARARGTLVETRDGFALAGTLRSVTPPADPFVYR